MWLSSMIGTPPLMWDPRFAVLDVLIADENRRNKERKAAENSRQKELPPPIKTGQLKPRVERVARPKPETAENRATRELHLSGVRRI
jgi:hypothetical protein